MSHSGPASRRNTLRSNDQQPLTPTILTSSNATNRRQSIRNEQNTTASQASTPSSINPSVVEEGYQPGAAISHPAGQVVEHSAAPFDYLSQYTFAAGGPLMWDWNSNMEFGDFTTTFYEPQGQLAAPEMQAQHSILSDFSTPYRVASDTFPSTTLPTTTLATPTLPTDRTLSLSNPSPIAQQQIEHLPTPVTAEPGQASGPIRAGMKRKAEESAPTTSATSAATATPTAPTIAAPSPAKRQSLVRTTSSSQASNSRPAMTRSQSHSQPAPPPPPTRRVSESASEAGSPRSGPPPPPEPSSSRQPPTAESSMKKPEKKTEKQPEISLTQARKIGELPKFTSVLPAGKVFPIQIGSELFRLSGASISSDGQYIRLSWEPEADADASRAPSYFSHYFSEQLIQTGGRASAIKTLYIDRDPVTFRDIALHLQGK